MNTLETEYLCFKKAKSVWPTEKVMPSIFWDGMGVAGQPEKLQ